MSVRRALLDPSGPFYKAMLELVEPPVSGAGTEAMFQCPICNLTLSEERLMVSHLALRPHWKAGAQLKILAAKKVRDLRCTTMLGNNGDYVDPFSCDINIRLDLNTISIILQQPVHPASLKPKQRFKKGPFSCNFCDILEKEFVETDFIAYQIHLAEHYSEQLESYFGLEGSGQYGCSLCPTEEVFPNLQCLVGHLASQHEILSGLYEATAPAPAHLTCDNTPVDLLPPDHFLLSSIVPWFPLGWPAIRDLTSLESELSAKTEQADVQDNRSRYQCLECLTEFPGVSELMDHIAQMEHINLHWVAETNQDGRFVISVFIIKVNNHHYYLPGGT